MKPLLPIFHMKKVKTNTCTYQIGILIATSGHHFRQSGSPLLNQSLDQSYSIGRPTRQTAVSFFTFAFFSICMSYNNGLLNYTLSFLFANVLISIFVQFLLLFRSCYECLSTNRVL
jgi:hypothetical protein